MARFKGVTYLTEEQYATLVANGTLTVEDVTINYDENMLYVTPDEDGGDYLPLTGGVIKGNLEVQQTLTVQNIELNGEDLTTELGKLNTALKTILGV